jgi:hypothetical protein
MAEIEYVALPADIKQRVGGYELSICGVPIIFPKYFETEDLALKRVEDLAKGLNRLKNTARGERYYYHVTLVNGDTQDVGLPCPSE